jgi:hypothetical protein
MAHDYNPNYSEDRDQEGHHSRPAGAKNQQDPISTNTPGMVVHTYHPSYTGDVNSFVYFWWY